MYIFCFGLWAHTHKHIYMRAADSSRLSFALYRESLQLLLLLLLLFSMFFFSFVFCGYVGLCPVAKYRFVLMQLNSFFFYFTFVFWSNERSYTLHTDVIKFCVIFSFFSFCFVVLIEARVCVSVALSACAHARVCVSTTRSDLTFEWMRRRSAKFHFLWIYYFYFLNSSRIDWNRMLCTTSTLFNVHSNDSHYGCITVNNDNGRCCYCCCYWYLWWWCCPSAHQWCCRGSCKWEERTEKCIFK